MYFEYCQILCFVVYLAGPVLSDYQEEKLTIEVCAKGEVHVQFLLGYYNIDRDQWHIVEAKIKKMFKPTQLWTTHDGWLHLHLGLNYLETEPKCLSDTACKIHNKIKRQLERIARNELSKTKAAVS